MSGLLYLLMKKAVSALVTFDPNKWNNTVCFRTHAKGNSFCNNESEIVFSVFICSGYISVVGTLSVLLYIHAKELFVL